MFKKFLLIFLSVLIACGCFFMVGCRSSKNEEETTGELTAQEEIDKSEFLYPEKNEDFRYNKYTYYVAITQCLSLKSNITIPDSIDNLPVYVIADNAFKNQTTIKTVSISDNVINIGVSAFENCSQLTSVKLPSNVQTMGSSAFRSCTALREIDIPNSLALIPDSAFSNCESLSYVVIEEPDLLSVDSDTGVENYTPARTVGSGAFSSCPNLKYIWFPTECNFGDDGSNDPLSGSLDNLTIYGYSQSHAAQYAASHFIDFVLIQNKSQLIEFKSTARSASQIQTVSQTEEYKGEELNVQIENVFIVRNALDYYVINEVDREYISDDFSFTPEVNTVIAIFGVKVKNNTSRNIKFNNLNATIKVDSYAGRFASFGTLKNDVLKKYNTPSYIEIEAGETRYIYFASIIDSEWEEIIINFGNYNELLNYNFTIKNTDNIIYIGSSQNAIQEDVTGENGESTTSVTDTNAEPASLAEEETTSTESVSVVTYENTTTEVAPETIA